MRIQQPTGKQNVTRRNNQYEKRLTSILKAASKVIARKGFEGASVRDVAARARIGLSGIYYYFHNKEELLFALQQHTFSTLVERLKERLAEAATPEEKLQAVIDNHFEQFAGNMDELKVCVHEIESLTGKYYQRILKVRQEYFSLVQKVVGEVVGKANYETDIDALFLFGSLNWAYMWYKPAKNADWRRLSKQFAKVFLNGIKAA